MQNNECKSTTDIALNNHWVQYLYYSGLFES